MNDLSTNVTCDTNCDLPESIKALDDVLTTIEVYGLSQESELIKFTNLSIVTKGGDGILIDINPVTGSIAIETRQELTGRILMEGQYYKSFNIFQYLSDEFRLQQPIRLENGTKLNVKRSIILKREKLNKSLGVSKSGKGLLPSDYKNVDCSFVFTYNEKEGTLSNVDS